MSMLTELFATAAAQRIGWALVHFLWQGVAVALLLALALGLLRNRTAHLRWAVSCTALLLMALLPVATALVVDVPERRGVASRVDGTVVVVPTAPRSLAAEVPGAGMPVAGGGVASSEPVVSAVPVVSMTSTPREPWLGRWREAIQPLLPGMMGAWLAGVALLSVWHLGGWVAVRRLQRVGTDAAGPELQAIFLRLLPRVGLRRPVRLLASVRVAVPVVVGWLRPVVLVPACALSGLTPGQWEAILAHELAHIRRWDPLVLALQALIETLLFYHPAVWWVSRQIRQESEQCCDDLAVRLCGDRRGYAHALAAVAERGASGPALALGAGGGAVLMRIRRILGVPAPRSKSFGRGLSGGLALVLLLAGLAVPLAMLRAEAPVPDVIPDPTPVVATPADGPPTLIVTDFQGKPVAGAAVTVVGSPARPTDAAGRVALPVLAPNEGVRLAISAPGFIARSEVDVVRRADGTFDPESLRVSLYRAATLAGRVLGPDGRPLEYAPLSLTTCVEYPHSTAMTSNHLRAITDEQGRFTMENVPPGTHALLYPWQGPAGGEVGSGRWKAFTKPGEKYPSVPVKGRSAALIVTPADGQRLNDLTLDLSQSVLSVEGRVTDPAGRPLAGATVSAVLVYKLPHGTGNACLTGTTDNPSPITDAAGRYVLRNLPPGPLQISVAHPNYQRGRAVADVTLAAGRTAQADLRLVERYDWNYDAAKPAESETAESLRLLDHGSYGLTLAAFDRNFAALQDYTFLNISPKHFEEAYVHLKDLGLGARPSPEDAAAAARSGDFYFRAPGTLVPLNGCILLALTLPEAGPNVSFIDRIRSMTRTELADQLDDFRSTHAAAASCAVREGDTVLAVRPDGRAAAARIDRVDAAGVALHFYYVGILPVPAATQAAATQAATRVMFRAPNAFAVELADGSEVQVRADGEKLSRLGVTMEQLSDALKSLAAQNAGELAEAAIDTGNGQKVRLLDLATLEPSTAPAATRPAAKVATPRTFAGILAARPAPKLEDLAWRSRPEMKDDEASESFWDILKLRETRDPKAVPVLSDILTSNAGGGRIHGYAAAQALFCIDSPEALAALDQHLAKLEEYTTLLALGYVWHWDMPEPQRSRFIRRYLLKEIGPGLELALDARPGEGGEVRLTLTVRNVTTQAVDLRGGPFDAFCLRSADGTFMPELREGIVDRHLGEKWVRLKPGETHTVAATGRIQVREVLVQGDPARRVQQTVLQIDGEKYLLNKPGPYEAVVVFEQLPVAPTFKEKLKLENPWVGRAVSKAATLRLDAAATQPATQPASKMAADPVAGIRAVLPKDWTMKVEENAYPFYRPEGKGRAILFVSGLHAHPKQQEDAVVYIMPPDYEDGGEDPTHGEAQTYPPRLIAATPEAKVYLWGDPAEDWPTLKQDVLKAIFPAAVSAPATAPSSRPGEKRASAEKDLEEQGGKLAFATSPSSVGVVARRVFTDSAGRQTKEILYGARGVRATEESDLVTLSIRTYRYDEGGRCIREEVYDPAMKLQSVRLTEYNPDGTYRTSSKLDPDGRLTYLIRYRANKSVSHLYFDGPQRLVGMHDEVPADLKLVHGTGKPVGALSCGLAPDRQACALRDQVFHVTLQHVGGADAAVETGSGYAILRVELRDESGALVPQDEQYIRERREGLSPMNRGPNFNKQPIHLGCAAVFSYHLNEWYRTLRPGRYTLTVWHRLGKEFPLQSNPAPIVVTADPGAEGAASRPG